MAQFLTRMFTPPKPKTPDISFPSAPSYGSAQASAESGVKKKRRRITETILTGPQGLLDKANVRLKTLLGE